MPNSEDTPYLSLEGRADPPFPAPTRLDTGEVEDSVLVEDGLLGDPRGGRKPGVALDWEVVRSLTVDDLPLLSSHAPNNLPAPPQRLIQVKHSHHLCAQLLAQGIAQEEVSLITGYAPAYISSLKSDPLFQEILAHYTNQREIRFVDVVERMKSLGLSTLDELQNRLETEPDSWTKRELMELAELTLVKPNAPNRQSLQSTSNGLPGSGGGLSINVQFVTSNPASKETGPIIDAAANFVESTSQ